MSSGLAQRPAGMRAKTRSYNPGTCARAPSVSSVSNQPGNSALTWMLSAAQARARLLLSWTMPPLAGGVSAGGTRPKVGGHAADIDDLTAADLLHVGIDGFR